MIADKQKFAAKQWTKRFKNTGRNMWLEICKNSPHKDVPDIYEELSLDVYNNTKQFMNEFIGQVIKSAENEPVKI